MQFLVSDAVAATGTTPPVQGEGSFSLLMIAAIFVLFYFMLIRPQNKRAKEHRALVNKLKVGDEISTASGLVGKIATVGEQYIKLTIAENVDIHLQRSAVAAILPKGTIKSL